MVSNISKVEQFVYVPADEDEWVVGRVEAVSNNKVVSYLYLYGGKLLWCEFGDDERDIVNTTHSNDTIYNLIKNEMYYEAFNIMLGLHMNLTIKHKIVETKRSDIAVLRRDLFGNLTNNKDLLRSACEAYFSLVSDDICDVDVEKATGAVIDCYMNGYSFNVRSCLHSYKIPLTSIAIKDVNLWGDMYRANDVNYLEIKTDGMYFSIVLGLPDMNIESSLFRLSNSSSDMYREDLVWSIAGATFNAINNLCNGGSNYNVEGLLYYRDIANKASIRDDVCLRDIVMADSSNRYRYNINVFELLADCIISDNKRLKSL